MRAQGENGQAIADALGISEELLGTQIEQIFVKLGGSSWPEITAKAVQMGLIHPIDHKMGQRKKITKELTQPEIDRLFHRALLKSYLGQPYEAFSLYSAAYLALTQVHDPTYEAHVTVQMGLIYLQGKDYPAANRLLQKAHRASTKDTPLLPELSLLAGMLLTVSDNIPEAVDTCRYALELFQLQGNLYGQIQALISLAGILIDTGLLGEADSLLTRSLQIGKSLGSPHHLNLLRDTQSSRRLWLSGQFDRAEQVLANQETVLQQQIISPLFLVEFLRMRGTIYCDQARFIEAQAYLNIALTVAIEQDAWTLAPEVLTNLAWLQARQGNLELAWDIAKQAQALIVEGNMRENAQVRTLLGAIARQQGQYQMALFNLESAQKTFEGMDFKLGLWSCHLHLAQTYLDLGYERRAAASLQQIFPFAAQSGIGSAYFWDPDITARLSVFALSNEIEILFSASLAARLSQHLTVEDVELLNKPEQPQVCLSYIDLLKAMGTDEAFDRLHTLSISNGVPQQIRDQAQKALPHPWSTSMQPQKSDIRIFCLGPLQVERKGELIKDADWAGKSKAGRQKVKALLAYLVEQGRQGATKDALVEALWGEMAWGRDETKLESSLARTLSALRQVLEPDLISPAPSAYILTEDGRYYLNQELCWIDVVEFQYLMKQARDAKLCGQNEVAQAAYKEALSLYEGEYLRDVSGAEEWAGLQRFALSQQLGVALTALGSYRLEQGQTQEALMYFQDAIKEEPTNEIAHYKYIDALRREERIEEAIQAYQRCRKTYEQEVDEVPPETITQLYKEIKLEMKKSSLAAQVQPQRSLEAMQ